MRLNDAIVKARACPYGGLIVSDDEGGYTVHKLPPGAEFIVPGNVLPIPLNRHAELTLSSIMQKFLYGAIKRVAGSNIRRRKV